MRVRGLLLLVGLLALAAASVGAGQVASQAPWEPASGSIQAEPWNEGGHQDDTRVATRGEVLVRARLPGGVCACPPDATTVVTLEAIDPATGQRVGSVVFTPPGYEIEWWAGDPTPVPRGVDEHTVDYVVHRDACRVLGSTVEILPQATGGPSGYSFEERPTPVDTGCDDRGEVGATASDGDAGAPGQGAGQAGGENLVSLAEVALVVGGAIVLGLAVTLGPRR